MNWKVELRQVADECQRTATPPFAVVFCNVLGPTLVATNVGLSLH